MICKMNAIVNTFCLDKQLFDEFQTLDINKEKIFNLIKMGANVNAIDGGENLLMHHLYFQDHYGINIENIKFLLDLGVDINYKNEGFNCLFMGGLTGSVELVEFLIKNGADVNCVSDENESLLDWFLLDEWFQYNEKYPEPEKVTEIVKLLKKYGAKTNEEHYHPIHANC